MVRIAVDREKIAEFCRKWGIQELSLFGSVLREDFRQDSDVDVLLTFAPSAGFTFDNRVEIEDQLAAMFGRKIDVVAKHTLRNPFRRHSILASREILYAS